MHSGKGVADRQVFLTKDGSQTDLIQSIISTEFYKNISEGTESLHRHLRHEERASPRSAAGARTERSGLQEVVWRHERHL